MSWTGKGLILLKSIKKIIQILFFEAISRLEEIAYFVNELNIFLVLQHKIEILI